MCSRCPPRREIACVQHATGCHPCMTLDGTLSSRPCSDGEAAGVKMTPPLVGTRGLRGLRGGLDLDRRPWPDDLGFPRPGRPQEAVAQEIQVRAAKHLPLQHFQTVNVALDRPGTPRQRDPGFDGLIVLRQSGGKAAQGVQRTIGGALQPGIELGRLPLAHELGKVLGQVDGFGDRGRLRAELDKLLDFVRGALRFTPQHQPGRSAWRQGLGHRLRHVRQGPPWAALPRRETLGLPQAAGIGRDDAIAPRVALLTERAK